MTLNPLNHKRLSSTPRMQSRLRLLNAASHHREHLNATSPESATSARRRHPPRGRLSEDRPPKDGGLLSPHPGWVIAEGLRQILSATAPKLLWRFFGSCIRTARPGLAPSE